MILVHGRGATAQSILTLSEAIYHPDLAYFAPQAYGNAWYPYSFLAPIKRALISDPRSFEEWGTSLAISILPLLMNSSCEGQY